MSLKSGVADDLSVADSAGVALVDEHVHVEGLGVVEGLAADVTHARLQVAVGLCLRFLVLLLLVLADHIRSADVVADVTFDKFPIAVE